MSKTIDNLDIIFFRIYNIGIIYLKLLLLMITVYTTGIESIFYDAFIKFSSINTMSKPTIQYRDALPFFC